MKMPSETALAVVEQFSWSSNVSLDGKLVGQQFAVAMAIDKALAAERERCAMIAQNLAHGLIAKSRTNKTDRHASAQLIRCRDKIRAASSP